MAFDFRCSDRGHRFNTKTKRKTKTTEMTIAMTILILILLTVLAAHPVDATISFVESGRAFPSKKDPHIGQPLLRGYEYMGRLQYVPENPTLCPGTHPNQKFDIVTPTDGLPVALLAKSGGCSIYEKAKVASSMMNPSNTVGYLIVQDSSKGHLLSASTNLPLGGTKNDNDPSQPGYLDIGNGSIDLLGDEADVDEYDLTSLEPDSKKPKFEVDLQLAEENGRALIDLPEDEHVERSDYDEIENNLGIGLNDVNFAVLHVSYKTGIAMLDAIAGETTMDRLRGGFRIILNGKEHSSGMRTVIVWMLITISCCACGCACLLLCVHTGFEEEEEHQAPRRPARRRLTLDEVRTRFPSYHFHPGDTPITVQHHPNNNCCPTTDGACDAAASQQQQQQQQQQQHDYMQISDECTICLDEFIPGVRVRKLPCGHVFHSTCIARWLIERSAVCPLCKLDLYIEPEEEDENESSSSTNNNNDNSRSSTSSSPPSSSFWGGLWGSGTSIANSNNNNNNEGYTQLLTIPSGAPEAPESTTALLENDGEPREEPRSWWPFSLETVPSTDFEEEDETNNNGNTETNHHRQSSRPSPLSAAASALSFWTMNNVFGSSNRRRRRHRSDEHEMATTANLTELTEPLVSSSLPTSRIEEEQQATTTTTTVPAAARTPQSPSLNLETSHNSSSTAGLPQTAAEL